MDKKGNVKETLQKITDIADSVKAVTYDNQGNLFFMFAPVKTKTFKNEKSAVELAQAINNVLTKDNRLFKQRVDYGLSVHSGPIIAKQEKEVFKFMGLGNTKKLD